jgi:hypothetical protein
VEKTTELSSSTSCSGDAEGVADLIPVSADAPVGSGDLCR